MVAVEQDLKGGREFAKKVSGEESIPDRTQTR